MAAAAESSYDQEQEKLRREYDGLPNEDVVITVPRGPEVNPEIYRDVEPLLFRGFVSAPAVINGVPFVFKSLNHHEFERLRYLDMSGTTRDAVHTNYSRFLAQCVLLVDGINILPVRDEWVLEITKMFNDLSEHSRDKIIYQVSEINRRASQASLLVEVFSMEDVSRMRWAQMKGLDLSSTAITGYAGTDTLGLNYGQLLWRALNHIEDQRREEESDWDNAKFVASSMAGKGMQKVHSQDKRRRQQEAEARLERRDKILRLAIFGEDPEEASKGGAQMQVARTVEELANQLERDLKGEKDWHDMVVEQYESKVREAYLAREQQIEQMRQEHLMKWGDRPVIGETMIKKGLTPQEVDERIKQRRENAAKRLASAQKYASFIDPNQAAFTEKWIKPTGRDPSQAIPALVNPREPGKPFNRGDA